MCIIVVGNVHHSINSRAYVYYFFLCFVSTCRPDNRRPLFCFSNLSFCASERDIWESTDRMNGGLSRWNLTYRRKTYTITLRHHGFEKIIHNKRFIQNRVTVTRVSYINDNDQIAVVNFKYGKNWTTLMEKFTLQAGNGKQSPLCLYGAKQTKLHEAGTEAVNWTTSPETPL